MADGVPRLARDVEPCPRCGRPVRADRTELATMFACAGCGTEWAEDLALDFTSD